MSNKYRYTAEQVKAMMDVSYESYKALKDSGLFDNGVPPKAHNINWAMMSILAGNEPKNKLDVEMQQYLKERGIDNWTDLN